MDNFGIKDFARMANQQIQMGQADAIFTRQSIADEQIGLGLPVKPPGNWTKFLAAFQNVPLLKHSAAVRNAVIDVADNQRAP